MGTGERLQGSDWFKKQVDGAVAKDRLSLSDRIGNIIGFAIGMILIAFFAIHETRPTGFFTEDFGRADAALLYLVIVMGMISSVVRFILGQNNPARLPDAVGLGVFFVIGLYFLVKFPFDFSHFAEPLPRALEPLLDWVSGGLARWLLGLGVIASPIFSVYTFLMYTQVRKRLTQVGKEV